MTILPIDTLEELWEFEGGKEEKYHEPLTHFKAHSGPQILVCHDMRGGYLEEESTNSTRKNTRTCSSTEWDSGKEICSKILENEKVMEKTVDQLVAVANHYGFDGWLINIENEIDEAKIELLIEFCASLTRKSKESNKNSKVIWYDSVLHSGKLKWQNALNADNNKFYNACDAIYLNYNWKDGDLLRSAEFGILERIFVGIDVWARGCVGEFDCDKSFALAKLFHMSVALFGPGWIYEKFEEYNQIVWGIQFWSKLYPYIRTRPLTSANFSTNFHTGMEENWRYRLSSVELQPQKLTSFCHQVVGSGLTLFGRNRNFLLFNFDSLPYKKLKIICKTDSPIKISFNKSDPVEHSGSSTWLIKEPGSLESITIHTTSHDETVIKSFRISTD
ncbi:unnamed protein product [Caenorhabditis brenneri]